MASILDTLSNKAKSLLSGQPAAVQAPQQSLAAPSQEGVQRLLSATSGKAGTTGGGALPDTTLSTATAVQSQEQVKQAQEQANLALQQQNTQELQAAQQYSDADIETRNRALSVREQFQQKTTQILQQLSQQRSELDLRKQKSATEQLGLLMRLQNNKYVAKLQDEGRRARLQDKKKFQEAATEMAFKNQLELAQRDLSFRSMMRAEERDFERKMSKMNADLAWNILMSEVEQQTTQSYYNAAGTAISSTLQALKNRSSKPDEDYQQVEQSGTTTLQRPMPAK
jgi:hypothetical protein